MKTITKTVSTIILRRPAGKPGRHRMGRYAVETRTHPWFEQRAQRMAELGSRS